MAIKKALTSRLSLVASRLSLVITFLSLATSNYFLATALGAVRQEVYVTARVQSFGGYVMSEGLQCTIDKPGTQDAGSITVEGQYNGEYPWIMRIYTDNLHFIGVGGTLRSSSAAGLVSKDGRFALPLLVHCPGWGEGVFRRIPDISEAGYIPYQPSVEPTEAAKYTECVVMGIDPRNASWVAGADGILFTDDDNLIGDITVKTPFQLTLQVDAAGGTVQGSYDGFLYIEIVPAP